MPNVGDPVLYVPDKIHALDIGVVTGEPAWVLGLRLPPTTDNPDGAVKELTPGQAIDILRTKNDAQRRRLTPVRPGRPWKAKVRGVNEDGTLDLDIEYIMTGCTHRYDRVPEDPDGKLPHTWHTPAAP